MSTHSYTLVLLMACMQANMYCMCVVFLFYTILVAGANKVQTSSFNL